MGKFIKELEAKGLKPFPPHGNYMLVDAQASGKKSQEIVDAAQERAQVIIKTIKPMYGNESYFRVTPGTPEESERFVKFVREYF
jgi:histidinol-phosphate/aromatic aminotransferase/cobyric acid decarboxylase-like protein